MGNRITGLDYPRDIVNGGTLELQMAHPKTQELGSNPGDFPPAAMNLNPMTLKAARHNFLNTLLDE